MQRLNQQLQVEWDEHEDCKGLLVTKPPPPQPFLPTEVRQDHIDLVVIDRPNVKAESVGRHRESRASAVSHSIRQGRNIALTVMVEATAHCCAIPRDPHRMAVASHNHFQSWLSAPLRSALTFPYKQQCHHFGEIQCDMHLQKPGWRIWSHTQGQCIVQWCSIHGPRRYHHWAEERCEEHLQKLAHTSPEPLPTQYHIGPRHWLHKQPHPHCKEAEGCVPGLQRPEYKTFPRRMPRKMPGDHGAKRGQAPPEPVQCHKCHACHAKWRSMSPSAMPTTWSEGRCRQVPHLPRKQRRRPRRR